MLKCIELLSCDLADLAVCVNKCLMKWLVSVYLQCTWISGLQWEYLIVVCILDTYRLIWTFYWKGTLLYNICLHLSWKLTLICVNCFTDGELVQPLRHKSKSHNISFFSILKWVLFRFFSPSHVVFVLPDWYTQQDGGEMTVSLCVSKVREDLRVEIFLEMFIQLFIIFFFF